MPTTRVRRRNPEDIEAILQRRRIALEEQTFVEEIIGLYRAAYNRIRPDLLAILQRIADARRKGQPLGKSWLWRKGRLEELLNTIEAEVQRYADQTAAATVKRQAIAIKAGIVDARNLVRATIGQTFGGIPPLLPEVFVGYSGAGTPIRKLFERFGEEAATAARDTLGAGIISGDSGKVIGRQLARDLGTSRYHGILIGRTEVNRVRRESTGAFFEVNSDVVQAWRWQCAFQLRTCPACLARDGEVFPTSKVLSSHPNCRCAMVPITRFSQTPDIDGEAWFRNLSPIEQRGILGPTAHELYSAGKVTLKGFAQVTRSKEWGEGLRVRSLKNMRKSGLVTIDDIADARIRAFS